MACFIVGGSEAVVVTGVRKAVRKHELAAGIIDDKGKQLTDIATCGYSWTRKLGWLENMLWGATFLLLIEHVWHGEVVFFPPFLTAMSSPAATAEMLHEMATVGVGMAALVTLVWFVGCLVADAVAKRASATAKARLTSTSK